MIAASKAGSQERFASFEELMAYGRSDGRLLQPAAGLLRRIRRIFKKKSEAPKMQICRVGEIEPDSRFCVQALRSTFILREKTKNDRIYAVIRDKSAGGERT